MRTHIECIECGHKFARTLTINTYEIRCPSCGGYDTEVA